MSDRKITLTVDDKLLRALEKAAARDGVSSREFLLDALKRSLGRQTTMRALERALTATGGLPTKDEVASARRTMRLPPLSKKKKKKTTQRETS